MDKEYLAHSAHDGFPAQTYLNHVQNVHDDAVRYAKEAAAFAAKQEDGMALVSAVTNAASLHDLGKLEEENQAALHAGKACGRHRRGRGVAVYDNGSARIAGNYRKRRGQSGRVRAAERYFIIFCRKTARKKNKR